MTDDELLALYGSMKEMASAMKAREATLDAKTAALNAAIIQLGRLPETLGKQTSQYIAAGVKASIQDDFSRPIADAVKGPIAELNRETYHARQVMAQVGREVLFQSWISFAVLLLLGFALGGATGYYLFVRDLNVVSDRLHVIQQQIAPLTAADAKPGEAKTVKTKKGH
jgi:hypothetical protein